MLYRRRCGGRCPADNLRLTIQIENAGRVDSAGSREITLRLSQFSRERKQCVDVDPDRCRSYWRKVLPDGIDARLAAKPATARDRAEALGRIQFYFHARGKIDNYDIIARLRNSGDLPGLARSLPKPETLQQLSS